MALTHFITKLTLCPQNFVHLFVVFCISASLFRRSVIAARSFLHTESITDPYCAYNLEMNTADNTQPQTKPARVPMTGVSWPWTSGVALSALVSSMQEEAEERSF